jgi:hypothetical protein
MEVLLFKNSRPEGTALQCLGPTDGLDGLETIHPLKTTLRPDASGLTLISA